VYSTLLALVGSGSWGVADFLAGHRARAIPLWTLLVGSQAVGLAVFFIAVMIDQSGPGEPQTLPWAVVAGLAGSVGLAALYRGMGIGLISIIAPIAALGAVIPILISVARGEDITAVQAVGMPLALCGVVLTSFRLRREETRGLIQRGVGTAFVAALMLGIFLLTLGVASKHDALWASLTQRVSTMLLIALLALNAKAAFRFSRADVAPLIAIGSFDAGGTLLFAFATSKGSLAIASVLISLYPVIPIVLAQMILRERIRMVQWAGITVMLVGAGMITGGA
jgi:drug/metabolite transporter (DMT)-like permease